ncbi:MAG: hypothetical protein HPY58_05635 [Firmicutes bacterium]|nr:hypothetical protein [Bacillota bacterium]
MVPGGRGTRTGQHWETVIKPVLEIHYPGRFALQVPVGQQLFGGIYKADALIRDPSGDVIISAKWQQVRGTAEQKILYDIASLLKIIREANGRYRKAYIVLGGIGFSNNARNFLLEQGHKDLFTNGHLVEVITIDEFLAHANTGNL